MNDTKRKILNTAFQLFLQKSFKEVTMNDIVKATGLSKGAFYHYFKSKEQVFAEVIEMFFVTIPTTIQRPLDESSLYAFYHSYLQNTSQAYALLVDNVKGARVDVYSFFSLSLDAMKRLPDYREKSKKISAIIIEIWKKVIRTAREKGEISSVMTDEQIACFFKFTMEGMGMKSQLEGSPSVENDKELLEMWDRFYDQIKVKQSLKTFL